MTQTIEQSHRHYTPRLITFSVWLLKRLKLHSYRTNAQYNCVTCKNIIKNYISDVQMSRVESLNREIYRYIYIVI